jgi:DNA-directed RNA polymerase
LSHRHNKLFNPITGTKKANDPKRQGVIALHKWVIDGTLAVPNQAPMSHASLNPMLVPPVDWATPFNGGYLMLPTKLLRGRGIRRQSEVLASARPEDQKAIYDGVNAIQKVAWKLNTRLYDIQTEAYELGLNIAGLPCRQDIPIAPTPVVYEMSKKAPSSQEEEEAILKLLDQEDMTAAKRAHWEYGFKMQQANYDKSSQMTLHHSKLEVAMEYYHEKAIYFPYSLDFRGRAYPMTPVFNHLGSDDTRCLLEFAEKKPLGKRGYRWLKIHLANLMGYDKESFDARLRYIENNMSKVIDSAEKPLIGEMWWLDADDPWQALGIMLEIADIEKSDIPHEQYLSSVPVHQDGSCNGLQHYAALGRDLEGATAVNLVATDNDKPADVYSRICDVVAKKVHHDATELSGPLWGVDEWDPATAINPKTGKIEENPKRLEKLKANWVKKVKAAKLNCEIAQIIDGYIDRKMVKQTVMTSVYGVTSRGAREQVHNRLREKVDDGILNGRFWASDDFQTKYAAAGYIADLILSSIGDLFEDANAIMNWLAEVAEIISSEEDPVQWVTPLGFPILQPYRNHTSGQIRTVMQHVVVADVSESLPVSKQRQKTAFPPNFIHSLDATHMLMTAKECGANGLDFSAVHDSYWTQAGSIDEMNEILRNQFVKLYEDEILEDFAKSLKILYPGVDFPDVPNRGSFQLDSVKGSKYFFA